MPSTLKRISIASALLSHRDLERWLSHAYDILDHEGIGRFIEFTSHIEEEELQRFRTARGLRLSDVAHLLTTFLRGLSGTELRVAAGDESYTDTVTVFLPHAIDRYADLERDFMIYKLLAAHAWAQLTFGTLLPGKETLDKFLGEQGTDSPDIAALFRLFPGQGMAEHIYAVIEAVRLEYILRRELPGLMADICDIKNAYLKERPSLQGLSGKTLFVERLYQMYLGDRCGADRHEDADVAADALCRLAEHQSHEESLHSLMIICRQAEDARGEYSPLPIPFPLMIRPAAVSLQLRARRRIRKQTVERAIAKLLSMPEVRPRTRPAGRSTGDERRAIPEREYLLISGRVLELDAELREILDDRGGMPGGILVKGAGLGAEASPLTLDELVAEADTVQQAAGGIPYDEWDFKRGGFKKKWCMVHEKDIHPDAEPFVEMTLKRYRGTVTLLRRKFELLRREPKMLRRQKEGDDIDLDAVVEAYADSIAGRSPSEGLFTKYDRHERSMASLFLLDMSGSTKGWILEAEKEALVLMAEALETLGDRYAIYGFSGMTRNKCDFFHCKSFDEPYSEMVKRRISGISPKDYTRMGPAIRHATNLLSDVKARTKLLITISDGRPEDYDAYKGTYGIEDTRKALIEAKEQGVHSFCITIDREAGSYIRHMYGAVNYAVIDDVRQLPHRITEIYRRLTF
ncbi:MAG: VWA domain-containing protein [Nitrospirae bacterium]|nr:VWA domain-containing protein [Nitrospirota bacterium]